jgi:hypothetical protein
MVDILLRIVGPVRFAVGTGAGLIGFLCLFALLGDARARSILTRITRWVRRPTGGRSLPR